MTIGICLRTTPIWVEEFKKACVFLNLPYKLIDINKNDWQRQLSGIDVFIWRIHLGDYEGLLQARIKLPIIEEIGIFCFPSSKMAWIYDDKISQTFIFEKDTIPTPSTFISCDEKDAMDFTCTTKYPLVFKTSTGASSSGVRLVNSISEGKKIVRKAFNAGIPLPSLIVRGIRKAGRLLKVPTLSEFRMSPKSMRYVYFQEKIETDGDLRITTFGNDIISVFKRLNRPNDFRASGSGRWQMVTVEQLPIQACDLALAISERQNYTCMAYDFLQNENQWLVSEMSYSFLLNKIYTDTLFRKTGTLFEKIAPIPIGVMHLQSCLSKMNKKMNNG
jgi:glutathione synthase/RimK-type ligase-like ATP-grasp enzyme